MIDRIAKSSDGCTGRRDLTLALFLAALLMVLAFVACGNGTEEFHSGGNIEPGTRSAAEPEEDVETGNGNQTSRSDSAGYTEPALPPEDTSSLPTFYAHR